MRSTLQREKNIHKAVIKSCYAFVCDFNEMIVLIANAQRQNAEIAIKVKRNCCQLKEKTY